MIPHDLHLDGFGLRVTDLVSTSALFVVAVASTSASAACPRCGTPSDRVHSRYARTLADLPQQGRPAALRLFVRRFRCTRPDCPRRIFCERLPGLLKAYARSTARLTEAQRLIGFALGGEAGARLAAELAYPTSPDTLLRRVKRYQGAPLPEPRFVGVDDWAWRKGQSYGTILIDLERSRVIDLLPGRDGSALAAWLQQHPGVEVITRDRWASFAQAATAAAPQALQVADRWHLLKNLREAVERLLGRLSTQVGEVLQDPPPAATAAPMPGEESLDLAAPEPPSGEPLAAAESSSPVKEPSLSPRQQARAAKRQQRAARHQQVRALHGQGWSQREIARLTGLSRNVVRRYCREEHCPAWKREHRPSPTLQEHAAAIDRWVEAGGRNTAALFRELQAQGCAASYDAVRRFVNRRLGSTGRPGPRTGPAVVPPPPVPSARQLSFEFIRRPEKRKADEQARLDKLRAGEGTLQEGLCLAGEFADLVRRQSAMPLTTWLVKAEGSSCPELRGFAAGVRQDEAAVAAGLSEAWSNGPVEGHVNRLKLIGRATRFAADRARF